MLLLTLDLNTTPVDVASFLRTWLKDTQPAPIRFPSAGLMAEIAYEPHWRERWQETYGLWLWELHRTLGPADEHRLDRRQGLGAAIRLRGWPKSMVLRLSVESLETSASAVVAGLLAAIAHTWPGSRDTIASAAERGLAGASQRVESQGAAEAPGVLNNGEPHVEAAEGRSGRPGRRSHLAELYPPERLRLTYEQWAPLDGRKSQERFADELHVDISTLKRYRRTIGEPWPPLSPSGVA